MQIGMRNRLVTLLRDADHEVSGCGFLAGGGMIVTCAHVLRACKAEVPQMGDSFQVQMPPDADELAGTTADATLEFVDPRYDFTIESKRQTDLLHLDFAVLRLCNETAGPVQKIDCHSHVSMGEKVIIPVRSEGKAGGRNITATVDGNLDAGLVQLEQSNDKLFVVPGCSGAPVFVSADQVFAGCVVSSNQGAGYAKFISVQRMLDLYPRLKDHFMLLRHDQVDDSLFYCINRGHEVGCLAEDKVPTVLIHCSVRQAPRAFIEKRLVRELESRRGLSLRFQVYHKFGEELARRKNAIEVFETIVRQVTHDPWSQTGGSGGTKRAEIGHIILLPLQADRLDRKACEQIVELSKELKRRPATHSGAQMLVLIHLQTGSARTIWAKLRALGAARSARRLLENVDRSGSAVVLSDSNRDHFGDISLLDAREWAENYAAILGCDRPVLIDEIDKLFDPHKDKGLPMRDLVDALKVIHRQLGRNTRRLQGVVP